MSLLEVKTGIIIRTIEHVKPYYGYEITLMYNVDDEVDPETALKFLGYRSNGNVGAPLFPIWKSEAEKMGMEYTEKIISKYKGPYYYLLKLLSWSLHKTYKLQGDFKYKITHKITRQYE